MKLLLDECVTKKLKSYLKEFPVFTVMQLGWSGAKNGTLMSLCVDNGFNLLLTIDKNLIYQQNLSKYDLSIVVLNSTTSKIEDLTRFIPEFKGQLASFKPHQVYIINAE